MISKAAQQVVREGTRITYQFSEFREERDTFGPIQVPADRLWAAQTQRSMQNFDIARDTDRMPVPIIRAFGVLKKCAAKVNVNYGLPKNICTLSP